MTEQQSKILQITQYIVQMPPTQDIVQIPATQDILQIPATQDILQMAAQMLEIQPLKRTLEGNRNLEFKEWNGSKRVKILERWYRVTRTMYRLNLWKEDSTLLILYTVIVVSIYNLTVELENSTLWTALLCSCLEY